MKIKTNEHWQTKTRSDNWNEYQIYLAHANDGNGNDITTGEPLKSFDDWLAS